VGAIHDLVAYAGGGLQGIQTGQRDWSPFVAHFTSYAAMSPVRSAIGANVTARGLAQLLASADEASAAVAEAIATSGVLRPSSPSQENQIPECVCLSECSLPGLLGLCERFGRFGWVFRKCDLYALGARPCLYVGSEEYGELATRGRSPDASEVQRRIFGLANVYTPPGHGTIQDFTHEREWRLFSALDLRAISPDLLIAPSRYVEQSRSWSPCVAVLPIDTLHEWGL
jgi:hypothetical protein